MWVRDHISPDATKDRSECQSPVTTPKRPSRRRKSKQGRMLRLRPSSERSTKRVQWGGPKPRGLPGVAFFQIEIEVNQLAGSSGFGSSTGRVRHSGGRPDLLGQIEDKGWKLEHVGYVFIETGSTTTNRVLSTGQGMVTRGNVTGIYLFRAV